MNASSTQRNATQAAPPENAPTTSIMEGLVLAAGAGRRLRPRTNNLPKTLVALDDGSTVLERTLANFRDNGITRATIVVGCFAEAITDRLDELSDRCELELDVVVNDHAEDRNNAYSLWCARDVLARGVLLCNGDTMHPPEVQRVLLEDARSATVVRLAVDSVKSLGDEEMKVQVSDRGTLVNISKQLAHDSFGEYIGLALIPECAADELVAALVHTWQADVQNFYEAAFQHLASAGTTIETRSIGTADWVEIDDLADLRRANELVCRS